MPSLTHEHREPASRFPTLLVISFLALTPILTLLALKAKTGASLFDLMRDPTSVSGVPPYIGFFSQVGIFFWISAATVCLFSSHILKLSGTAIRQSQFLKLAGLFTLLLAIDDIFMMHDYLLPVVFKISEKPILVAYAAFMAWLLIRYREIIMRSNWRLLALSLLAYASSIALDKWSYPSEFRILIEDSCKLTGIVLLLSYFVELSITAITALFVGRPKNSEASCPRDSQASTPYLAPHHSSS